MPEATIHPMDEDASSVLWLCEEELAATSVEYAAPFTCIASEEEMRCFMLIWFEQVATMFLFV